VAAIRKHNERVKKTGHEPQRRLSDDKYAPRVRNGLRGDVPGAPSLDLDDKPPRRLGKDRGWGWVKSVGVGGEGWGVCECEWCW
jgi:hypothetical protein